MPIEIKCEKCLKTIFGSYFHRPCYCVDCCTHDDIDRDEYGIGECKFCHKEFARPYDWGSD